MEFVGKRFCNISCAAEYYGVSKSIMKKISSEYPVFKKHHNDFYSINVDGRNFEFIDEVLEKWNLKLNELDNIMKYKSFESGGEKHFVSVPKCVAMVFDLKDILGERWNWT